MENLMKKIEKKSKEELLELITELCNNNEDNFKYLKSMYSTKDNSEKHYKKIDRFLYGNILRIKDSINYFNNLIKTTANKVEIAKVGIYYLNSLFDVFECYLSSDEEYQVVVDVLDVTCSTINKINNNEKYIKEIYEIISNSSIEMDNSDLFEIFYYYFDYNEKD